MLCRFVFLCCLFLLVACGSSNSTNNAQQASDAITDDAGATDGAEDAAPAEDTSPPEVKCDDKQLPVVALHGMLGSGDNFANHAMRFSVNGMCDGYFRAYDWNSLGANEKLTEDLDAFIDALLEETGQKQVNLMGHSAGGGTSYTYLADEGRAAKVANYVHIGSFKNKTPPGPDGKVRTLNLWSESDFVIGEKGDIEGATNVALKTEDHMSVASSSASFAAIYEFLNGEAPKTTDITAQEPVTTSGRVVTLGENTPQKGSFEVFEFDGKTGKRIDDGRKQTIGEGGYFGPIDLKPGAYYEYVLNVEGGDRPLHYFRSPQVRSDHLNYLRAFPSSGIASLLLQLVNFDDKSASLVVFSSTRGLVAGQDSLKINGLEVINEKTANKENTSIAFFFYDNESDQKTTEELVELPGGIPFLVMMDVFMDATSGDPIKVDLNGTEVVVPALKSDSEGPVILVFNP